MLYWSNEKAAKCYANLVVSLTDYAAKKEGSFAIFSNLSHQEPEMKSLEEMKEAADWLVDEFAPVEGYQGQYLRDMLTATRTFLDLLMGEQISYPEAIKRILGFEIKEVSKNRLEALETKIDADLRSYGYTEGTVAERVKKWNADNHLEGSKLVETAEKYLHMLQRETRSMIELPESEGWGKLDTTTGVVWGALSQYQGNYVTAVTMNLESDWKLPNFIDTISHELYPGHHTWYSKHEQLFKEDKLPLEASMIAICMADNLIFEGVPESGIRFIGIEDLGRRIDGLDPDLQRKIVVTKSIIDYVRILQVNACYKYHVGELDAEEAARYMYQDGWCAEAVARRVVRYFSHPYNGLYYPAYFYGRWIVSYAYDLFDDSNRHAFYQMAYEEPHSTGSFIRRVKELTGKDFDPITMAQS